MHIFITFVHLYHARTTCLVIMLKVLDLRSVLFTHSRQLDSVMFYLAILTVTV